MDRAGPDFRALFDAAPSRCLVVRADAPRFTVVAASDAYLSVLGAERKRVIGRALAEAFPSSPLAAVFERVIAARAPEGLNVPFLDERGAVAYIIHCAEDAAALGETQFRALFDLMPQLGWTALPDGSVDFYNRGWYEYTGATPEELLGWGWTRVHDPDLLPQVTARWRESIASGAPFEMEFPLRRRDGAFRWFLNRANPVRDDEGRVLRWIGINTDVHDRKQAATASEARLGLLLDSIRDYAVFMLDPDGRVATWNPGAARIKQYRADEIIGKHFSVFYPPEDVRAGKCERELEGATRTGRYEDEGWRVRKDGSRFWANVVISAVRDPTGKLVGFAKVTRDLTERRKAEDERLELAREQQARVVAEAAEERFRFLAEASASVASSLHYDTTLQSVARLVVPRWADWCSIEVLDGARLQTVAVQHRDPGKLALAAELRRRWPADPNALNGAPNVIRTGKPELYEQIPDELLVAGTHDPEQLEMARSLGLRSALVVPLIARGKALGALSLIWAESDRRYGPADVPLMEEIGRRAGVAVDNARLYEQAQDAVRLRDEFLSIASHELKTPLTSMQLQVSGVQRSLQRADPINVEKLSSRIDVIHQQIRRLSKLIDGLLDVSRAAAGRLQLEITAVDLSEVAREAVDRMRDDLASARCEVHLSLGGAIVGAWDRLRVDQIVTNFLTNAMKYGAGKPIEVSTAAHDGLATLTVRDHGIGIAAEDQQRIFERFGRAVSAEHYGGLGLGLWIVKELADAMGGRVTVESAKGQGARFTLELPRKQ
ncbi:MAG TPA: PAS domain S-box protein [Polyangia bacterium]|nr:PAS domain S-box protein [Polyangia bacterium]